MIVPSLPLQSHPWSRPTSLLTEMTGISLCLVPSICLCPLMMYSLNQVEDSYRNANQIMLLLLGSKLF